MLRRGVLRPDRPQQHLEPVRQDEFLLELLRVRADRQPPLARLGRRCDQDLRIDGHRAAVVDDQRIDLQRRQLGEVDNQLRELHQGQA